MLRRASLRQQYENRLPLLERVAAGLERVVRDALADVRRVDRISFRAKKTDSFVEKVFEDREHYSDPLSEVEDQVAGRVLVFFIPDIEIVKQRLQTTFSPVESEHKHPKRDAEFAYESHHLVCVIPPIVLPPGWEALRSPPRTFELQVRTLFMHAYAEPEHDLKYKSAAELPAEIRRELAWIAASAWGADHAFHRVWAHVSG